MADYLQGYMGTAAAGTEARNDITVAIKNWFANRNPLVTRLPYVPVETGTWKTYSHKYRARSTTLTTTVSATTTTGLTVADTSFLMNHDLLYAQNNNTGAGEIMQIAADPLTATTLSVTRGVSGTTALSSITGTAASTVWLLGNSRTGSEVAQTGLSTIGVARTQYAQTFQFPVQIGGSAQNARAQVFPGGIQSPFEFNQTVQLQNMVDDIENIIYYGVQDAPVDNTVTAKCDGLRAIFTTNNVTAPTNGAAYSSTDLIRDTLQACRTGGGEPDLLVVSTNFMSAFATWGQAVQRLSAGDTIFGTPIKIILAPFLDGVTIVEAPLLRPYTAIALTSSEIYIRNKRNPFWNLRGSRGDMVEGEWIAELAPEVQNESHHAWVEGITAFSAN
jgi:Family of unknown function (DUF5309)